MAIGGGIRKGNGCVTAAKPESIYEAHRKLEKKYTEKCQQLERAEKKILILNERIKKLSAKKNPK